MKYSTDSEGNPIIPEEILKNIRTRESAHNRVKEKMSRFELLQVECGFRAADLLMSIGYLLTLRKESSEVENLSVDLACRLFPTYGRYLDQCSEETSNIIKARKNGRKI